MHALFLKEIIGFCVTAHHNNISDGVSSDGATNYFDKFSNVMDIKYSFANIKVKIIEEDMVQLLRLFESAKQETGVLLAKSRRPTKKKNHFILLLDCL